MRPLSANEGLLANLQHPPPLDMFHQASDTNFSSQTNYTRRGYPTNSQEQLRLIYTQLTREMDVFDDHFRRLLTNISVEEKKKIIQIVPDNFKYKMMIGSLAFELECFVTSSFNYISSLFRCIFENYQKNYYNMISTLIFIFIQKSVEDPCHAGYINFTIKTIQNSMNKVPEMVTFIEQIRNSRLPTGNSPPPLPLALHNAPRYVNNAVPPSSSSSSIMQMDPNKQLHAVAAAHQRKMMAAVPLLHVENIINNNNNTNQMVTRPEEEVVLRVNFIFNNIAKENIDEKIKELNEIMVPDYYVWLVRQIVMKRVCINVTFHNIYVLVLEHFNEKVESVMKEAIDCSIKVVKDMLLSVNSPDCDYIQSRHTLKVMGGFFGLITLKRNRPIFLDEIDFKSLIIEAHSLGLQETHHVITFVARCLSVTAESMIFKLPNPWTLSIIALFREVHLIYEGEVNSSQILFEIELAFQSVGLTSSDIEPTFLLRDKETILTLEHRLLIGPNGAPQATQSQPPQPQMRLPNQQQQQQQQQLLMKPSVMSSSTSGPAAAQQQNYDPRNMNLRKMYQQHFAVSNYHDVPKQLQTQVARPSQANAAAAAAAYVEMQLMKEQMSHQQPSSSLATQSSSNNLINMPPQQQQQQGGGPAANLMRPQSHLMQQQQQQQQQQMFQQQPPPPPSSSSQQSNTTPQQHYHHHHIQQFKYADFPLDKNFLPKMLTFIEHPFIHNMEQIRMSFAQSCSDLYDLVFERCSRTILGTVESQVRKDFCMDNNAPRVKACTHAMTRYLGCSNVLIVTKEALCLKLKNCYKQCILSNLAANNKGNNTTSLQNEIFEKASYEAVDQNIDLILAFMQKSVSERLLLEIDERMAKDYLNRWICKQKNQVFIDDNPILISNCQIPEKLHKSTNGPTIEELNVYQQFQQILPGFVTGSVNKTLHEAINDFTIKMNNEFPVTIAAASALAASSSKSQDSTVVSQPMCDGAASASTSKCSDYDIIIKQVEKHLQVVSTLLPAVHTINRSLRNLLDRLHLSMKTSDQVTPDEIIKSTIISLMDFYDIRLAEQSQGVQVLERFKEAHLIVIRQMLNFDRPPFSNSWITEQVTLTWKHMEEPMMMMTTTSDGNNRTTSTTTTRTGKWNFEVFMELLKIHVISLGKLDEYLSDQICKGNVRAVQFSLDLLNTYVLGTKREFTVLNEYDIYRTIDTIQSTTAAAAFDVHSSIFQQMMKADSQLRLFLDLGLLKEFQVQGTTDLYMGCSQSREFDDAQAIPDKTEILMKKWFEIYANHKHRDKEVFKKVFLKEMALANVLYSEDTITRFFRLATVLVVERSLRRLQSENNSTSMPHNRFSSYNELDAYSSLIAMLIKNAGENEKYAKQKLLNKALGIIAGVLTQEHEVRPQWFNPMPFQRILTMLFMELQDEEVMSFMSRDIMSSYANTLHILRPLRTASFVYSWLELVSHRVFMARMLSSAFADNLYCRPMFAQLLVDILKYMRMFLNNNYHSNAFLHLYKGVMRVLIVIMNDFPEVLYEYHALFCEHIAVNSFQLRNVILSASPKTLPILPTSANLGHLSENISELLDPIGYCMEAGSRIKIVELKENLDYYLEKRSPINFLCDLTNSLKTDSDPFYPYDLELMNNLILYLGITAVNTLKEKNLNISVNTVAHTSQMDIIQNLVLNLDNAGRYLLLNVMINQLRYSNTHTHYFNRVLLYLFSEQEKVAVKEQITRVLIERVIVHRPHPWGLIVTITDLLGNPDHKFWQNEFTKCSEEIENILHSVYHNLKKNFVENTNATSAASVAAAATSN